MLKKCKRSITNIGMIFSKNLIQKNRILWNSEVGRQKYGWFGSMKNIGFIILTRSVLLTIKNVCSKIFRVQRSWYFSFFFVSFFHCCYKKNIFALNRSFVCRFQPKFICIAETYFFIKPSEVTRKNAAPNVCICNCDLNIKIPYGKSVKRN